MRMTLPGGWAGSLCSREGVRIIGRKFELEDTIVQVAANFMNTVNEACR